MYLFNSEVVSNQKLSQNIYRLRLKAAKDFCRAAAPGKFVMLGTVDGLLDPLLRRPFGICRWGSDWFEVVIKVVGKGSCQLSNLAKGVLVAVHGPLGNGYPNAELESEQKSLFLVAGGMGIASIASQLFFALDRKQSLVGTLLLYGAANISELILLDELTAASSSGLQIQTITDDGSSSRQGFVTQLLIHELQTRPQSRVFACGPEPMLKSVQKILQETGCDGYLSLENRMACGFGVCLGCVQTVLSETSETGMETAKVCTRGPVFPAQQVVF
ncbi:MAG: dihydroorotate dehydrogenase electron transfer subunit [Deltaproteobacteria bacterium]|nr:dihydroorotate dehydrogenase electron transfer subunit [Deltaproteobacteria bacterium]